MRSLLGVGGGGGGPGIGGQVEFGGGGGPGIGEPAEFIFDKRNLFLMSGSCLATISSSISICD
jgi:hypothetical protein